MLTQEILKKHIHYEPEDGRFTRIYKTRKVIYKKKPDNNYLVINILKVPYLAHRLAWLYVYGKWPDNQIDHINGHKYDNRIENLRDIPQKLNLQNNRKFRDSLKDDSDNSVDALIAKSDIRENRPLYQSVGRPLKTEKAKNRMMRFTDEEWELLTELGRAKLVRTQLQK